MKIQHSADRYLTLAAVLTQVLTAAVPCVTQSTETYLTTGGRHGPATKAASVLTDVTVWPRPPRKAVAQVSPDQVVAGAGVGADVYFTLIGVWEKGKASHRRV